MFENHPLHPCVHPLLLPPSFRSGMNDIYLLLLLLWRRYLLSKYSVTVSPHRKGVEKEVTLSPLPSTPLFFLIIEMYRKTKRRKERGILRTRH
ncbi:hypothetical protein CEXT_639101 [Caerostris extrusa]|uniref:Uncharacterized protein n=1 Tax=Caerostris extrusa TaxID=172846 RepID=A0AAV4WMS0_CAEEX|nr:hypothetical protein CEXT_639101 [Caerostris extrusa]